MTLFMTKVWGFGEPAGPLQFASEGWRRNALDKLRDGDRVLLVGTLGGETAEDERGRALGIMEPTREPVRSLDFDLRRGVGDFNEAGEYKWPFGLHNRRAWILLDRPRLSDIAPRPFAMDAAQGIVALTDEEADAVDRLARREVALLAPRAHAGDRLRRAGAATRRGPPPADVLRRPSMHMRREPASTYAMELVGARRAAIKVGWAFDPARRCEGFNQASMPTLGGLRYRLLLTQRWDTARLAYAFEQRVLRSYAAATSAHNREVMVGVPTASFQAGWARLLGDALNGRSAS